MADKQAKTEQMDGEEFLERAKGFASRTINFHALAQSLTKIVNYICQFEFSRFITAHMRNCDLANIYY